MTRAISDGERQFVRGRRLRAHLRSCADCASFKQAIEARRASFGAIAPALPATAAVALLQKLLGGGGGSAGGGGLLGFSAAGGKLVAGAGATKGAAALAAAVAVGTGVGAGGARIATEDPGTPPAAQARAKPAPAEPTIEPTAPVAPQLKNGSYPKRTLAPGATG